MIGQSIVFVDTARAAWVTPCGYLLALILLTFVGGKIDLPGADWRKVSLFFLRRLMIRLLICAPIAGLYFGFWPKYYQRMQISDQGILLDYRWPKSDVTVSFNEIQGISVAKGSKRVGGGGRRWKSLVSVPVYCLEIKTAREIFSSRAVEQLTKEQKQAIDDLRLLIEEKRRQ